ncbi:MAG: phosphotransferase [Gammaproteobacteria bacterium]|nr:phosphotransferase [Gammaproteobacteria bacterium]MDE0286316.1 phosphotransferase [Gammaproteobacteria bacterium]MDE0511705.1 phosphotransferase [Gammaproteobacteria bacterium]
MSDKPLIPESADAITTVWLQQALAAGGALAAPAIQDIEVEALGDDNHAAGRLLRCHLRYDDGAAPAPESVIVKLSPADPVMKFLTRLGAAQKREYTWYRRFAPGAQIRSPALFYGDFDERNHNMALVLEDLRNMKAIPQSAGIDAERGRVALRAIARLHGQFWEQSEVLALADCYNTLGLTYSRCLQLAYQGLLAAAHRRFRDEFTPETLRLTEVLGMTFADHAGALATGPLTFIHGDYRADNMFFDDSGAQELVAIDWQTSGAGSGLYDVAYFLATNVSAEDRRRIEREALAEYHDIVCGMGAKNFSFDDCWRSYRQNMLSVLLYLMLGCGGTDVSNEQLGKLLTKSLRGVLTAIADLDVVDLLPQRKRLWSPAGAFSSLSRVVYNTSRLAYYAHGKITRRGGSRGA